MANKRITEQQAKIPEDLLPGYEWETFGGKGKRIKKKGSPIKEKVYQESLKDKYSPRKFAGGGRALRGYGKAYMKDGKVK